MHERESCLAVGWVQPENASLWSLQNFGARVVCALHFHLVGAKSSVRMFAAKSVTREPVMIELVWLVSTIFDLESPCVPIS